MELEKRAVKDYPTDKGGEVGSIRRHPMWSPTGAWYFAADPRSHTPCSAHVQLLGSVHAGMCLRAALSLVLCPRGRVFESCFFLGSVSARACLRAALSLL